MVKQMHLIEGSWIRLSEWLIECSICGTLLLVALCVFSYLFRSKPSSMRHAVWVTGMVGLLVLPLSLSLLPRLRVLPSSDHLGTLEQATSDRVSSAFEANASHVSLEPVGSYDRIDEPYGPQPKFAESAARDTDPVAAQAWRPSWNRRNLVEDGDIGSSVFFTAFAWVWLAGSSVFTLRLLSSYLWLHVIERTTIASSTPAVDDDLKYCALRLGLARSVRLVLSKQEIVPMAWGVLRPRVMLPELVIGCKRQDRRTLLLHELGHVSRRDPLWHLLCELSGVVYWFHPLFWYARHQCAAMRENACDDLVLNAGVEPGSYARCLLEFVSKQLVFPINGGSGVAMSMSSRIEDRIRAVMSRSTDRSPLGKYVAASLLVSAIGCLLPLCMLRADNGGTESRGNPSSFEGQDQVADENSESSQPASDSVLVEHDEDNADGSIGTPDTNNANKLPGEDGQDSTSRQGESNATVESDDSNNATAMENGQLTAQGRVLGPGGLPIPDALLIVDSYLKGKGRVSKPHRTNAKGEFQLEFRKKSDRTENYMVWIHAHGYAVRAVYLNPLFSETDQVDDFEIRLPRLEASPFLVLDPDGAPIAGALVVPSSVDLHAVRLVDGMAAIDESSRLSGPPPDEFVDLIGQRTDADGCVELTTVPRRSIRGFEVTSERFGTQRFGFRTVPQIFRLSNVGEIRGRVLIDSPGSVEGTEIWVRTNNYGDRRGIAKAKLDKNAEFHVPAIAVGKTYSVWAFWDDALAVHPVLSRRDRHMVVAGQVLDLVIQTCRPVKVNGQVLTSDTREPVVGARASLNCLDSPIHGIRAMTDEEGRFTLRIAPGPTLQHVTSLGRDRSLNDRYDHPRLDQISIPDDVEVLDLPPYLLPTTEVVRGRLQDSSGRPIDGATVIFQEKGRMRFRGRAVTDSNGRFAVGVREWAIINGDAKIAERYRWAILDDERAVNGLQEIETTQVRVLELNANELLLVRP